MSGPAAQNLQIDLIVPDDQQESEDDLKKDIFFKDAVVMNTDWTIETINSQINKGNIDLQPGFQRRAAWDDTRKSRLIESIIVGVPIPNIVLAENRKHRGRFIVIDGKQRLLAINDFMKNAFVLRGLDMRRDLGDKTYSDPPQADKEYLENSTLRSTLVRNWSDDNFLYTIFFRLNSGSLPLSPQELRKALIGGHLLDEIDRYLARSKSFKEIFGDELDKRMRDSELVLRFVAFDRAFETYQGDLKEFLDTTTRFYEEEWSTRALDLEERFVRLDRALDTAFKIFGKNAFKKWLGGSYERRINRAIFDCITRFFAEKNISEIAVKKHGAVQTAFHSVCVASEFRDAIEKTTKSRVATSTRIKLWGQKMADALGLKYVESKARIE